ncbi:MAG: hypothetical protein PHW33_00925 [Candidatus Portnoybacteria bacterium]|jgi:hypothetical protein|nr:hypothetical protein [Candidatus Portnoybacteria bacterium]
MNIFERHFKVMPGKDPKKISEGDIRLKGEEKTQTRERFIEQTVEGVGKIIEKDKNENQDKRMAV